MEVLLNTIFLTQLQASLGELTAAAGLDLVEAVTVDDAAWLEYRRDDLDGALLLTVTYRADNRTVAVEFWRPAHLLAAHATGDVERAVVAARSWQTDPATPLGVLIAEIRETVADCLRRPDLRRHP